MKAKTTNIKIEPVPLERALQEVYKMGVKEAGIGLEKVIRSSILTDDGWVYTIPASFVEDLKQGRMPE